MEPSGWMLGLVAGAVVLAGCSKEPRLSTHSEDALRYYRQGVAEREKFYYREAKTSFERALAADSTFAMAWARLGILDFETANVPAAKADLAKAVAYGRHATEREQLLIAMWENRIAYRNAEAARFADSVIALYPGDQEAYLVRGSLYELSKDFESAIRLYRKAVAIDSTYAPAVMTLGYAYSNVGEQDLALREMQRYIRLQPDAADPRASYADLLVRVGDYDEALRQYRKSLELKPDYWYSIREIGRIDLALGELKAAEQQFNRTLELLPKSTLIESEHLAVGGYVNLQRGKYGEAAAAYRKALDVDSTNYGAATGLVNALARMKQFDAAESVVDRIRIELTERNLAGTPRMTDFYLMRSALLLAEGKLVDSQVACDSAFEFSTYVTRPAVYRQLAEIHLRGGEYETSLDDCEGALRVNPNNPEALLTLARVYHARGDMRMTREIGGRLLRLWQHADPDFQKLAELRSLLGTRAPA